MEPKTLTIPEMLREMAATACGEEVAPGKLKTSPPTLAKLAAEWERAVLGELGPVVVGLQATKQLGPSRPKPTDKHAT